MNILFFHANGIVPTAGGISRTTYNLVRLFRERGHYVWMIGAKNLHPNAQYDDQQFFLVDSLHSDSPENKQYMTDFLRINTINCVINQSPFSSDIVNLLSYCRQYCKVKVLSCYHNSILTPIYNYAYQKEYSLKKRGLSIVFNILKIGFVKRLLTDVYIIRYRKAFRVTAECSDVVVLLCDGQVKEWQRMSGYKSASKVAIIPNFIQNVTDEQVCKKEQIVLWVGTFDYAIKRPDIMLRIWKSVEEDHPDWALYMLGDGPSLKEMKLMALQLGLKHVVFTGRVNPNEYYKKGKIQCVTSVHEAFPMVPIESMIEGNPVIAFNSYTAASFVISDHVNGLLVEPFKADTFIESLRELMNNEHLRNTLGESAKRSVNRFSEENVYALWRQILDSQ